MLHAAHPAGDIGRRFPFTFGHQTQQEHFTVFRCHLHVGRIHLVRAQQLGTYFGGDPGIGRGITQTNWLALTHFVKHLCGPFNAHRNLFRTRGELHIRRLACQQHFALISRHVDTRLFLDLFVFRQRTVDAQLQRTVIHLCSHSARIGCRFGAYCGGTHNGRSDTSLKQ